MVDAAARSAVDEDCSSRSQRRFVPGNLGANRSNDSWGGAHGQSGKREMPALLSFSVAGTPSLLPGQTLQENYVDAIVRGQGELTLLEVAENLAAKQSFHGVHGVSSKQFGLPQHAPERRVALLDDLPTPAFEMADFDAYERVSGERKLAYATSVGCPYACNYCTDMVFYKRRFNALEPKRVVDEVTELVAKYRITEVAMLDSNLPVDWRRARDIAQGFVGLKIKFCLDLSKPQRTFCAG